MPASSPLLAWFSTFVLLALAARAAARLLLARGAGGLTGPARNAEAAHAAMGFGMAVLLVPGLPRPPTVLSLGFFAAVTAFALLTCGRKVAARLRGRVADCGCAPKDSRHLLDPHHVIVGAAMIVMLLRPATQMSSMGGMGNIAAMPGLPITAGAAPGVAVLLLLGYVWLAALVLGYGLTRLAPATAGDGGVLALLGSPATVYGCELAMTVLTGLMLLS